MNERPRYTLENSLRARRTMIMDNKESLIVQSALFTDEEECRQLFSKCIELNRKHDDDQLYLKEVEKL